jgi:hypothetical protein
MKKSIISLEHDYATNVRPPVTYDLVITFDKGRGRREEGGGRREEGGGRREREKEKIYRHKIF